MTRSRTGSGKKPVSDRFPNQVDIPVPIGGLGSRLTEMLMWCRTNVAAGTWDQRAHGERPKKGRGILAVSARFYFVSEADAQAFRKRWAAE